MQSNNYILKNGKVLTETGFINQDIEINNGEIINVGENLTGAVEYDCTGQIITPGFIDVHVHLREPGMTHKEDIASGSYSAIKGGYTHIFAMPNTKPCMDSVEEITKFNQKVQEKAYCNVLTFSAISKDLKGEELVDFDAINQLPIAGFSDDGKGVQDDAKMLETMRKIKELDSIMSLHCEDERELGEVMGCINEGVTSEKLGLIGINNASEWKMIKRDTDLMEDETARCRYHVCHVSTSESVEVIKAAQIKGYDVTGEVSPHHLVLDEEDIVDLNTNMKMNPPLRSKADHKRLIDALNEGTLNIIATDHAPHHIDEKNEHISKAPFGIIGLDSAFSTLNTYLVKEKLVSLETILMAMTYNPAARFNLKHGIAKGMPANITIIDAEKTHVYTKENIGSKAENSPFLNKELTGTIVSTIVDGQKYEWSENE